MFTESRISSCRCPCALRRQHSHQAASRRRSCHRRHRRKMLHRACQCCLRRRRRRRDRPFVDAPTVMSHRHCSSSLLFDVGQRENNDKSISMIENRNQENNFFFKKTTNRNILETNSTKQSNRVCERNCTRDLNKQTNKQIRYLFVCKRGRNSWRLDERVLMKSNGIK